jgi:hypothetical protein
LPRSGEDPYDAMRREMMTGVDVCIALAGSSRNPTGMLYEKSLADKDGIPYLPIPYLGGFAAEEYESRKTTKFVSYGDGAVRDLLSQADRSGGPLMAARVSVAAAIAACLA